MTHEFHIYAATNKDKDFIRSLITRERLNPLGLDWRRFWVARTENGHLIGCVQLKPHRDGSMELASLAVAPDWRGQGVGKQLVWTLLEHHPGQLYLTCRASLEPFYAHFGFENVRELKRMPAYFRWAARLFGVLRALRITHTELRVMHRR